MPLHLIVADIGVTVQPYSAVLGIAAGGTNASSQTNNGVCYYDGTKLTTKSSFTYDGTSSVALTNASALITLGGDWTLQRDNSTTSRVSVSGAISIADTWTSTSVNRQAFNSASTFTPGGNSSARAWAMFFGITQTGAKDTSDSWAITGLEGSAGATGAGNCGGANGGLMYCYNSGSGTMGVATGLNLIAMTNTGGGHMTAVYYAKIGCSGPAFSANNQTRAGLWFDEPPDPSAFSGCTATCIHFTGGSGVARGGMLFNFDKSIYRASSGVLGTDGDWAILTAGRGLRVKEGTNAKAGLAVLVGGTLVVNTTAVTANSRIYLTTNTPGGTPGWLQVSARVAGTSFTILSSNGADTSSVAWLIVEPA